jgi:wyosine [tRNA(Phe)-imidazoG37] synthetase (radical SAM superfamily)
LAVDADRESSERLYADHRRHWRECQYVYPVVSRRARGLSIGVNLNLDTACNFNCIYCQVDRRNPPPSQDVDLTVLAEELDLVVGLATDGSLFTDSRFAATPAELRRVNDIAFSGDAEPTTCPRFVDAVRIAAEVKDRHCGADVKIVLITNSCYLTRPQTVAALEILDAHQGEVWAKLDAGTEEYYRRVNRPNFPLQHVLDNITATARGRPICIQSLWMRIEGAAPPTAEVEAFADRLNEIAAAGGRIRLVQIYTVARATAEDYVGPLSGDELAHIARTVSARSGLPVEAF